MTKRMTKRKLIIHAAIYLFIIANAIPVIKNGLASTFFWVAIVLAFLLLIMDIVRIVKYGIEK
jgi:predicted membrane channel-forming protein YqfA (hemolysin III family)